MSKISSNNNREMELISKHVNDFEKRLQEFNESLIDAFMFQIATIRAVGDKQINNTNEIVNDFKKREWTKAFEKANGDIDTAYEEYTKDAFFY